MENEDNVERILSVTVNETVNISFPVRPELEPVRQAFEHIDLAVEYYLLARYAYLHRMFSTFMVNSFWVAEHLILSILVLEDRGREQVDRSHRITKYWEAAKNVVPEEMVSGMGVFDSYISKVLGYFAERYPVVSREAKLLYSGKSPKVSAGEERERRVNFGKVAQLNLDELDHFFSFMIHDLTIYKENCSINLMVQLDRGENRDLYLAENKYSVIYPNKKYPV